MRCNEMGHIREADQAHILYMRTYNQNWYALTRMIGANPRRIVAMIGCYQQHVACPQAWQDSAKFGVEPFKMSRITRNIPAVAIEAVELYEIGKCQAAIHG